ncbi:hypothetical protein GS896_25445 [Rhodococcus hoagii]|nr:hypothetical protein [Prescottella equi]MBM4654150.1 hypothetical protein [Prescottella equi]MBM4719623.1 hypothetical protein [Prescottella equi]NKR23421.1 hypothetical protein [Prescottella equi]NKT55967.1 hypothetical protein [Prescottella equi]
MKYTEMTAWIDTNDVQVGDRIACLLSDAEAYPTVTGWADGTYTQTDGSYRDFQVSGDRPWWVKDIDLRSDLNGKTLIVAR